MRVIVLIAVSLLCGTVTPAAADDRLNHLLDLTASYVAGFKRDFSQIIASESYHQTLVDQPRRPQMRQLESEVFFVTLDNTGGSMTVRRVLRVDGRHVPDTAGRVEAALTAPPGESRRALATLANESARYNLGDLTRNFSDPTLALLFAGDDYRRRFRFADDGAQAITGMATTRVTFRERDRPTVIRDGRGGDYPASGTLWIADDGRIWRTELQLEKDETSATLDVRYRADDRLEMLVPESLSESYAYRRNRRSSLVRISGTARYSNYRRFETSGRIVAPPQ